MQAGSVAVGVIAGAGVAGIIGWWYAQHLAERVRQQQSYFICSGGQPALTCDILYPNGVIVPR